MKTRLEHIEVLRAAINKRATGAPVDYIIDYAIENGMPVAPEQVEPVVGEMLTEATRLVDGMIVAANEEAARYEARSDRWYVTGVPRGHQTSWILDAEWRIVFVPGDPVTGQKHETKVIKVVGMWDWRCTCGCHGRNYETRSAAEYWANRHDDTHPAAQS